MADDERNAMVTDWIAATNAHDTEAYLSFFTDDAVLDDPSVGSRFEGRERVADYYEKYFIGYNTTTRIVRVAPEGDHVHLDVHFIGDFPGGQTDGVFDITFTGKKISFIRADLT